MDARIYNDNINVMVSSSHTNLGNTTQEQTFELSYTHKKSSTWNCSMSMKSSVESSLKVRIPKIIQGDVKLGFEIPSTETSPKIQSCNANHFDFQ